MTLWVHFTECCHTWSNCLSSCVGVPYTILNWPFYASSGTLTILKKYSNMKSVNLIAHLRPFVRKWANLVGLLAIMCCYLYFTVVFIQSFFTSWTSCEHRFCQPVGTELLSFLLGLIAPYAVEDITPSFWFDHFTGVIWLAFSGLLYLNATVIISNTIWQKTVIPVKIICYS